MVAAFWEGTDIPLTDKPTVTVPLSEPTAEDLDAVAEEEKVKEATAPYVDPWDIEPTAPAPPANDADRPRWIRENVTYLEALGRHRSWTTLKQTHPEIAERQAYARRMAEHAG